MPLLELRGIYAELLKEILNFQKRKTSMATKGPRQQTGKKTKRTTTKHTHTREHISVYGTSSGSQWERKAKKTRRNAYTQKRERERKQEEKERQLDKNGYKQNSGRLTESRWGTETICGRLPIRETHTTHKRIERTG